MFTIIHTHGTGPIDFSSMRPEDLIYVQREAVAKDLSLVPGVFLRRDFIEGMELLLTEFASAREAYANLRGFSIEGPLLGTAGGVPSAGIWSPTAAQWLRMASWGALGLRYIVMAPDGADLDDDIGGIKFKEVVDAFYRNGVRLALGHFQRNDAELSARRTSELIEYVQSNYGPSQSILLTDHLFNDMPRNFKHVWRSIEEQANRESEIAAVLGANWHEIDLDQALGPVPGTLLRAARDGKLLPFLNFDGDHVDLEICKKTVEFLGPGNVIGITDDTEISELAGEGLHQLQGSKLWFRGDGIVAAGTGFLPRQIRNLRSIGCDDESIGLIFRRNPDRALTELSLGVAR